MDRLLRLGWASEKMVPFGYASDGVFLAQSLRDAWRAGRVHSLRVLHTGIERKYRGVETLKRATDLLRRRGIDVEVRFTGGKVAATDLPRLYEWADVFVACGLCEPWGMRVNDAIHAGLPVVVSSGMGASMIVEQHGCGSVYRAGDAKALADALLRFITDFDFMVKCRERVAAAHNAWLPETKAKEFIKAIAG